MPPFQVGDSGWRRDRRHSRSKDERFSPGEVVSHFAGWRDRAIIGAASATKIDTTIPEQAYLGPLGFPGFAAYIGMLQIGKPRAGETVFVSAAAGSVRTLSKSQRSRNAESLRPRAARTNCVGCAGSRR